MQKIFIFLYFPLGVSFSKSIKYGLLGLNPCTVCVQFCFYFTVKQSNRNMYMYMKSKNNLCSSVMPDQQSWVCKPVAMNMAIAACIGKACKQGNGLSGQKLSQFL